MRYLDISALLAVMLIGCTSRGASRYEGTVTNDGLPESPGTLTLAVLGWTDTSFDGHLEIGPPLGGSGDAYGWFPNGVLTVVTVSGAGDTILWKSDSEGADIGGRYSIIGGRFQGQGGTWHARLSQGPAITGRPPSPSLRSELSILWDGETLLTLGLIAFLAWLVGRWILRSPREKVAEVLVSEPQLKKLKGTGGWMAWFMLGQGLTIVLMLARLPELWSSTTLSAWTMGTLLRGLRSLLAIEAAVHVAQIVFPAIGLYLTAKNHPAAPRFWFAYLMGLVVYGIVDILGADYLHRQAQALAGNAVTGSELEDSTSAASLMNLRIMVWACVWSLYWVRSKRVRVTFGRGALDRARRVSRPHSTGQVLPAGHSSLLEVSSREPRSAGLEAAGGGAEALRAPDVSVRSQVEEHAVVHSEGTRVERACPWCAEPILAEARYCRYCHRDVEPLL